MARHPRLKSRTPAAGAFYHLTSRCALQSFLFGKPAEKSPLVSIIFRVAEFSGLEILDYCIMTNHFHLLVHVPPKRNLTKSEILRRYSVLYGRDAAIALVRRWNGLRPFAVRREMQRLRRRMGDITPFMQCLKQRITNAYHRAGRGKTSGTLWQGRFHSTLLESGEALRTVAAYIDLNPLRAGMAPSPAQYPYCARGAAARGDSAARSAVARLEAMAGDYSHLLRSAILLARQRAFAICSILGSPDFIALHLNPHLQASGRLRPIPAPVPLHPSLRVCAPGTLRPPATA